MRKQDVLLQFEKLEASKRRLLEELLILDNSELHYRPANGKWSIVQILFHLNSAEQQSISYMLKKSQGGTSVPKATLLNSFRSSLLTAALRTLKWKKPAVLPDPPEQADMKKIMEAWDETRIQLKALLEKLPDDMLQRSIFRHPAAGRMNIGQALTFMQEHFNHHLRQIRARISAAQHT